MNVGPVTLLEEDMGIGVVDVHCMNHAKCTQEGNNGVNPPASPQEIEKSQPAEAGFLIHILHKLTVDGAQDLVSLTSAMLIRVAKPIGAAPTNKLWAG